MGQHHRNGLSLLAKNGQVQPPPAPGVDLAQQAFLRGLVCPTCGEDATRVPIWPFPVGAGQAVFFCVACLFPKLAALTPPMKTRDQLAGAPADPAPEEG